VSVCIILTLRSYFDIVIVVDWVAPGSAGVGKRGQRAAVAARSP
jgi:hypothetical protein